MKIGFRIVIGMVVWSTGFLVAQENVPQATITNGVVKADVYLPDLQKGYYRATRFDWSGQLATLAAGGHTYFGKWFDRYDPYLHDSISGPVEEFLTGDSALGYDDAPPRGVFVKIGVGALRRPDASKYDRFHTYELVDGGQWSVTKKPDSISFRQELKNAAGYSYRYEKVMQLTPDKAELVLEHRLRNTGKKPIETDVYEHNFYMLDGQPTGPDVAVTFPFAPKPDRDLNGFAEVRGKQIVHLKELEKGQSTFAEMTGFGASAADNDIRVENAKTGAGVREIGSEPMSKLVYWSVRTTACPEAYVHLSIPPGQERRWTITYQFYTVAK